MIERLHRGGTLGQKRGFAGQGRGSVGFRLGRDDSRLERAIALLERCQRRRGSCRRLAIGALVTSHILTGRFALTARRELGRQAGDAVLLCRQRRLQRRPLGISIEQLGLCRTARVKGRRQLGAQCRHVGGHRLGCGQARTQVVTLGCHGVAPHHQRFAFRRQGVAHRCQGVALCRQYRLRVDQLIPLAAERIAGLGRGGGDFRRSVPLGDHGRPLRHGRVALLLQRDEAGLELAVARRRVSDAGLGAGDLGHQLATTRLGRSAKLALLGDAPLEPSAELGVLGLQRRLRQLELGETIGCGVCGNAGCIGSTSSIGSRNRVGADARLERSEPLQRPIELLPRTVALALDQPQLHPELRQVVGRHAFQAGERLAGRVDERLGRAAGAELCLHGIDASAAGSQLGLGVEPHAVGILELQAQRLLLARQPLVDGSAAPFPRPPDRRGPGQAPARAWRCAPRGLGASPPACRRRRRPDRRPCHSLRQCSDRARGPRAPPGVRSARGTADSRARRRRRARCRASC